MRTKEIIFVGNVNGTIYNSVEDYNNAVQAAIKAGGELDCSSRTYMAPDEDVDVIGDKITVNMTPFFNEGDPNYLDALAGCDTDDIEDDCINAFADVMDHVDEMSNLDELHDYQRTIEDIRTKLLKDNDDIQETIGKLDKQISLLEWGKDVSSILLYKYTDISNEVKDRIQYLALKAEVKEKKAPVETVPAQGGILGLLKEILGENK